MIFDRLFESRASLENPSTSLSDPANWLFNAFGAQPTNSNIVVTERNATQITAFWSAVSTISDTLAELPIQLIQNKRDGTTKRIKNHPALMLLSLAPNPMMNAIVLRSTCQAHTLTWGNGYQWVKRDRSMRPVELWPLLPQHTRPVLKDGVLSFDTKLDIGQTLIPAADVIHVPALSRNGISGMSIIAEQREVLASMMAVNKFGSKFFANGARAGGLITFPGKVRDPEKIRDAIERAAGGEQIHGLLVLSDDAKYQQFAIPPDDAQFLQTREFGIDEIGRMFRLPLHFLNKMGQATFNNLESMGTHFAQYTMMPWLVRHEQEYSRKLLTQSELNRGFRFKYNLAALMRGDIKSRSEVYAKGITFGWLTRNEVRELEDRNPLEGLDDPLIPLNLGVVGETQSEPEPPPDSDDPPPDDDDGNSDSDADRSFLILTAAAQRLANKEANKMRAINNKPADEQLDAVTRFYEGHVALMVENLAMTPIHARQYCRKRIATAFETSSPEALTEKLLQMVTSDVAKLVNEITEGLQDEN